MLTAIVVFGRIALIVLGPIGPAVAVIGVLLKFISLLLTITIRGALDIPLLLMTVPGAGGRIRKVWTGEVIDDVDVTTVAEVTACRPANRTGLPGKRVALMAFVAIMPAALDAGMLSRMMLVPGEEVVMGAEVLVFGEEAEVTIRGLDNREDVAPLAAWGERITCRK